MEAGPPAKLLAGLSANEQPIRWSADGRSVFVRADSGGLLRLDLASGRKEMVKEFPAGSDIFVTPDGRSYVYGFGNFPNLFLIEGLKS